MQSDAHLFLKRYLKKLESYAQTHHIDADILEDIYSDILEKLLSLKQPLSQKKLVSIINALGEPEDIFEGDTSDTSTVNTTQEKPPLTKKQKFWKGVKTILIFPRVLLGKGIFYLFKGLFRGLVYLFKGLKRIFTTGLPTLLSWIIRIVLIIVMFSVIFGLIGAIGMRIADITIDSQSFVLLFDTNLAIPLSMLLFAAIFRFIALIFSFTKTPIKGWYFYRMATIIMVVSLTWLVSTGEKFLHYEHFEITKELPLDSLDLDEPLMVNVDHSSHNAISITLSNISTGDTAYMQIAVEGTAFSPEEKKLIENAFIRPQLEKSEQNKYRLYRDNDQLFSQKIPFANVNIQLQLFLPTTAKFQTNVPRLSNIPRFSCKNSVWRFEETVNQFVCEE
jgi:hypothetical protein